MGDDETFLQMSELLEIFYNDTEMNRELTMVRGNDFCEILGLFYDLTDRIRSYLMQQVDQKESQIHILQQYKPCLSEKQSNGSYSARSSSSNPVLSSSAANPFGVVGKSRRVPKPKGANGSKAKRLSLVIPVEQDPKYLTLLEQN